MTDNPVETIRLNEATIRKALSIDLIVSLIRTIIHLKLGSQAPIDQKKLFIDGYMQAWRNGLESEIERVYTSQVKKLQTIAMDLDDDVLHILIEIANTEGVIIRDEFVMEVQTALYKALLGNVGV